ncbi:hypothetical protein ASG90_17715 [Nocardioides sp. Soil797]|nr:hypothetical protein ASG90_17715 [Nocardioides sp. Soil797]
MGSRPFGSWPVKNWSTAHLVARCVLLLGPLLTLFPAPGPTPVWAWVVGIVIGLAGARQPDGFAGLGVILLTVAVWVMAPGDDLPVNLLLSAAVLVLVHVCGILASYGPPEMRLGQELLTRWSLRGIALVAGSGLVFGLARIVGSAGPSSVGWGSGVGAAVLLLLTARAALVGPRSNN